jgi:hypothetical protein
MVRHFATHTQSLSECHQTTDLGAPFYPHVFTIAIRPGWKAGMENWDGRLASRKEIHSTSLPTKLPSKLGQSTPPSSTTLARPPGPNLLGLNLPGPNLLKQVPPHGLILR